jgi:hypothetical protein
MRKIKYKNYNVKRNVQRNLFRVINQPRRGYKFIADNK